MSASPKLNRVNRTLIIRVPLPSKQRGGRKFVVGPGGIAWTGRRVVIDNAIVLTLMRFADELVDARQLARGLSRHFT